MIQEAILTKKLPGDLAEVAVVRATACGKNCTSCEGCAFRNELKVIAKNPFGIEAGKKVLIETKTASILGAVIAVYLFPIFAMFITAVLAAMLGATETVCVFTAFSALFVSVLLTILFQRLKKHSRQIVYTIVKELS